MVAVALACALMPLSAKADDSPPSFSGSLPSVTIDISQNADRWEKPPLLAQIIPQAPGVVLYRFGAGPGPWSPYYGPVIVPPGKQTMSAVLIAPDGTPGPIATVVARSDIHALPLSASSAVATSQAIYTGTPSTQGAVSVAVTVGRQLGTIVRRLGGTDRYGTSAIISAAEPTQGSTIIIATGQKFPDALTASGLAGCYNASVLLVTRDSIPPKTYDEIKRLRARHAIICGGTPAVSAGVANKLKSMGLSVERLSGRTRYETAVAVAQRIQKITGRNDRVFLARGDQFQDALVVSPMAFRTRTAILLSGTDKLYPATAKQLLAGRYRSAVLIGNALSFNTETGVRHQISAVERWAGVDVYDTSVVVASHCVLTGSESWGYVGIARGDLFADALCGGVLIGKQRGVILLTPPTSLYPSVSNALTAYAPNIRHCDIFGSNQAISDSVFSAISAIFH